MSTQVTNTAAVGNAIYQYAQYSGHADGRANLSIFRFFRIARICWRIEKLDMCTARS